MESYPDTKPWGLDHYEILIAMLLPFRSIFSWKKTTAPLTYFTDNVNNTMTGNIKKKTLLWNIRGKKGAQQAVIRHQMQPSWFEVDSVDDWGTLCGSINILSFTELGWKTFLAEQLLALSISI